MSCDYKMVRRNKYKKTVCFHLKLTNSQIDSDYYLPVLMQKYFLQNPLGKSRATAFFRYVIPDLTQKGIF